MSSSYPLADGGSIIDFLALIEIEEPGMESFQLVQNVDLSEVYEELLKELPVFFFIEGITGESFEKLQDSFEGILPVLFSNEAPGRFIERKFIRSGALVLAVEGASRIMADDHDRIPPFTAPLRP